MSKTSLLASLPKHLNCEGTHFILYDKSGPSHPPPHLAHGVFCRCAHSLAQGKTLHPTDAHMDGLVVKARRAAPKHPRCTWRLQPLGRKYFFHHCSPLRHAVYIYILRVSAQAPEMDVFFLFFKHGAHRWAVLICMLQPLKQKG